MDALYVVPRQNWTPQTLIWWRLNPADDNDLREFGLELLFWVSWSFRNWPNRGAPNRVGWIRVIPLWNASHLTEFCLESLLWLVTQRVWRFVRLVLELQIGIMWTENHHCLNMINVSLRVLIYYKLVLCHMLAFLVPQTCAKTEKRVKFAMT